MHDAKRRPNVARYTEAGLACSVPSKRLRVSTLGILPYFFSGIGPHNSQLTKNSQYLACNPYAVSRLFVAYGVESTIWVRLVTVAPGATPSSSGTAAGRSVQYGVRPTDLQLAASGVAGKVVVIEPTGAETELLVDVGGQPLTVVTHGRVAARPGEIVHLVPDPDRVHVFDSTSGRRLQ